MIIIVMLGIFFIPHSNASAKINNGEPEKTKELKYIIVWDNDGGCISFPLEEMPRFEYNFEDSLVRCVTTSQMVDIPLKDVHKYTLDTGSGLPTSIDDVTPSEGRLVYDDSNIRLVNFKPGSQAVVYTADGALLSSFKINKEGCLSIMTNAWKAGVYVLNVNNVSYKIYKK